MMDEDVTFITEEEFDFGFSFSNSWEDECDETEDEIFVGPVKHLERCVAKSIDINIGNNESQRNNECLTNWSPPTADKLEEITREANQLAAQLEKCTLKEKENSYRQKNDGSITNSFKFEKDTKGKIRLLKEERENRKSPRSPRRETYIVKDSPIRALLPSIDLESLSPLASPNCVVAKNLLPPSSELSLPQAEGKKSESAQSIVAAERVNRKLTPTAVPNSSATGKRRTVQKSSPAVGKKESVTPTSSLSPHSRLQSSPSQVKTATIKKTSCAVVGKASGFLTGSPNAPIKSKKYASPRSSLTRVRTGIPGVAKRLPSTSSIPKLSASASRSTLWRNADGVQPPSKVVLSAKAVPRTGSQSQIHTGVKGFLSKQTSLPVYTAQSRLLPPKKVVYSTVQR
uniref:Proline and serine rich coiled-coil 1 n=1 Tax=Latimeria chalumnae TaxID=7897 RepID=M3XI01_LATCH|nr:PREDICTED: proline/serine-rich coiled-coil protein 1 isoform X2 [Latimeria chalumnae]|eukprot:XP_005988504.1 PREDICTED: proline/serine-rich coiled-coil protein 1 isoform X2 [Latimeria chalumnae]